MIKKIVSENVDIGVVDNGNDTFNFVIYLRNPRSGYTEVSTLNYVSNSVLGELIDVLSKLK